MAPSDDGNLDDPGSLSAAAAEIFRMRRARDHVLPKALTGEPAWDVLLALYSEEPGRLTVSSVCYSSGVPHSTALRWIGTLEKEGLVQRIGHPRDEKITLLALTEQGRVTMQDTLKVMLRVSRG